MEEINLKEQAMIAQYGEAPELDLSKIKNINANKSKGNNINRPKPKWLLHNKNIKHGMVVGYLVAVFGRYIFSFISGWIFFGSYASYYNYNSAVVYSLVYNALYIVPEAILTVIVISIPAVKKGLIEVRRMADK